MFFKGLWVSSFLNKQMERFFLCLVYSNDSGWCFGVVGGEWALAQTELHFMSRSYLFGIIGDAKWTQPQQQQQQYQQLQPTTITTTKNNKNHQLFWQTSTTITTLPGFYMNCNLEAQQTFCRVGLRLFPKQFAGVICLRNLPTQSVSAICQCNLSMQSADTISRDTWAKVWDSGAHSA